MWKSEYIESNISLWLIISGLVLIVFGNMFDLNLANIDIHSLIANIGALICVVGLLQWLFDSKFRKQFFHDIREEIVSSATVRDSGISEFHARSRDVNFGEFFLTSKDLMIGVNYSEKLIDNAMELLRSRTADGKSTTILAIDPQSDAAKFLEADFNKPGRVQSGVTGIRERVAEIDKEEKYVRLVMIKTILRYSFVKFDGRVWIIPSTNGSGRREVPGFFVVHGTPWFEHYADDISRLLEAYK